ncbi:MAG: glucan biosynthesis protein G [Methylocystis sp.]|nr:MAG: glucan biosynthesis protein G [Methylocystis sp.]
MIDFTRRRMIGAMAAAGAQMSLPARGQSPGPAPKFGFDEVLQRAQALARAPFEDATPKLPDPFDSLDYDSWRDIRFKRDHALFSNLNGGFRLETFHLGFLYRRAVTVNTIRDGIAAPIPYSPALFDYGRVKVEKTPAVNTGFAGFRLHFPVNDPHVHDEAISFLGASYFRFLGRDQQYGLSARALCVEAGTSKETFPFFREFWVETPAAGSNRATIYALLDSEAATGAYRFDLTVGQESALDVQGTLFPRRAGVKLGLAPLTSMYLTGENDRRVRDGFRDELHDSDGLLIHNGSEEWLWRPLGNPPRERMSSFLDRNLRGFGLLQRDRTFESYQDLDLAYQNRPSYFVEPKGEWGDGRVELIELPTADETNDNIVASWTPAAPPEAGKPFAYAYRITAGLDMPRLAPNGRVAHTFEAPARALGSSEPNDPGHRRFLVDFSGGDLAYYVADPSQVEAVATTSTGRVLRASVSANEHIQGLRAIFDVAVKPGETADLRLFLRATGRTLTETWTYPWSAPSAT